jgi:glycosyltransferase involved in cell wall biosynthesis
MQLPAARWLAPYHDSLKPPPGMPGEYSTHSNWTSKRRLDAWLNGLDWLLFVEKPSLPALLPRARERGIRIACVPNWECLDVGMEWLPYVDRMICPTQFAYRILCQWSKDLGQSWDVAHVPWPIDVGRFTFQRRERCRKFLFVNGNGGGRARRLNGSRTTYRRKGIELIAATAQLLKPVPFLVYSLRRGMPPMPDNVEVRRGPPDNDGLYAEGDVCVQPSHWEGQGVQLLECQAAGMPLVTTEAPPMNECRPFRAVRAARTEMVFVVREQPVDAQVIEPAALAEILNALYDTDIGDASEASRKYVEQERSWQSVRAKLTQWLSV